MKQFARLGTIGRFKPLHEGAARMLDTLCEASDNLIIVIGSANKYDARNPFTISETTDMIDTYLRTHTSNYEFRFIHDYGHLPEYRDGSKWREEILTTLREVDAIVTGNPYVKSLLEKDFDIIHPADLVPETKHIRVSGSIVRNLLARGDEWKTLVPSSVSDYITNRGLDKRFRKEFGLETISTYSTLDLTVPEDQQAEQNHVRGVKQ